MTQMAKRHSPSRASTVSPSPSGASGRPWTSPDGELLQTFATITTDANRQLAGIQDRMPVIIERQDWPLWLGKIDGDPASLLRPAPEDVLRLWRVGKAVGNVKNDGAELIEPIAPAEPTLPKAARLARIPRGRR